MTDYGWTQPCCGSCWQAYSYGAFQEHREPARIREEHAEKETCVFCMGEAAEGIYVRVDPAKALFPTKQG